ncbi:Protein SUPPRESSOR OF protein SILENCING 3-like protein [Quillaja saponaria]|uniref:Protein SUPPRESSOR OF protein SILENCING 3-like protein n=1 Tax=Quillaja saponaria TaxID=32244 RepID=A0AAD7QEL5_QUISA|nr:Protein SUPPRESSOR OF protein SILENCING 3-like protein [Quillaja saponaria]
MAGGNNPKSLANKPSSSSASSSHRKSRWESNNINKSTIDPKSGDGKSSKPSNGPSPKTKPTPSPAHGKHPNDSNPSSGHAPIPSPGAQFPFPDLASLGPPPPPAYGFHMLERRTIVLADGSVRSYFALPPDYQDFAPPRRPVDQAKRFLPIGSGLEPGGFDQRFPPGGPMSPGGFHLDGQYGRGRQQDYWNSLGLDGRGPMEGSTKRKHGDEGGNDRRDERDELVRQRQHFLQSANPNGFPGGGRGQFSEGTSSLARRDLMDPGREAELRASKYMKIGVFYENVGFRQGGGGGTTALKHLEVDQEALKKAFIHFVKLINENAAQKKIYIEDGKQGRLQCVVCGRSSKDFPDMHALIMHTYDSDSADMRVDHLGLHKALCVLMGWNYLKAPDNSKAYQFQSADEAAANQDDLIMWPPLVIIHNTITGKGKDGRMEGMGNKTMDNKIRDLGFGGGKSKSLYSRDGHLGVTLIKFAGDQSGLKEAMRLAEYFEKDNHGRKAWARMQPLTLGKDDENNPNLVKVDEKGGKNRILYGYLGTAFDLDKVDFDTRKKIVIESWREFKPSM